MDLDKKCITRTNTLAYLGGGREKKFYCVDTRLAEVVSTLKGMRNDEKLEKEKKILKSIFSISLKTLNLGGLSHLCQGFTDKETNQG
jgi:hypothetical protein